MAINQAAMETICVNPSGLDGLFTVFGLYMLDRGPFGVLARAFLWVDSIVLRHTLRNSAYSRKGLARIHTILQDHKPGAPDSPVTLNHRRRTVPTSLHVTLM